MRVSSYSYLAYPRAGRVFDAVATPIRTAPTAAARFVEREPQRQPFSAPVERLFEGEVIRESRAAAQRVEAVRAVDLFGAVRLEREPRLGAVGAYLDVRDLDRARAPGLTVNLYA